MGAGRGACAPAAERRASSQAIRSIAASRVARWSGAISASSWACKLKNMSLAQTRARESRALSAVIAHSAVHDPVDTPGRHIDRLGDPVLRDPHWFEELAYEDLPWISGDEIYHGHPLPSARSKRLCTEQSVGELQWWKP
jgi:hypothetical protein